MPYFLGLVLLSRLTVLFLVITVTSGHELSNDTPMHMGMIVAVLSVIDGSSGPASQYAPFLPFLEALFGYPLHLILSDFLCLRLTFIAWEVVLAAVFYQLLGNLNFAYKRKTLCMAAFIFLPMGWMTTAVMAQDEVIAAVFVAMVLFSCSKNFLLRGLFWNSVGIVGAKIFLVALLPPLFALAKREKLRQRLMSGLAVPSLVYLALFAYRRWAGGEMPLMGVKLNPYFGINFWMILRDNTGLDLLRYGSLLGASALAISMVPAWLISRSTSIPGNPLLPVVAVSATLALFFALFYHMQPEYLILLAPPLICCASTWIDAILCGLVAVLPWMVKFFLNAQYMMFADSAEGKKVAFRYFKLVFNSPPEIYLLWGRISFSIVMIVVAVRLCRQLNEMLASTNNG